MKSKLFFLFLSLLLVMNCTTLGTSEKKGTSEQSNVPTSLPLNKIKLPPGFAIEIFAQVENARSMALGADGIVYVGNRHGNKVYAVKDTDGDNKADKKYVVASGLNMPNGVAYRNGNLYIAEVNRILRIKDVEKKLEKPTKPEVIFDQYPTDAHHGWKYIAFGPDGKLYVPVGAPCNICEKKDKVYASITRMNPDGTGMEVFASGIRNTVGFTWHPKTGEMWFTDNGRDNLGDNFPPCELNKAPRSGLHFGYPYCHAGEIADPEFGQKFPCSDFTSPALKLGPHVAPLGLKFYTGTMFPETYSGSLFIAEHGSWNRTRKIGYRVMQVKVENGKAMSYEVFADGWLDQDKQEAFGRPVDVLVLKDGSMLVSDDKAGVIYRIIYKG